MKTHSIALSLVAAWLLLAPAPHAQSPGPQPLPLPPAIAAPRDIPYPGTIRLHVDATDIEHHLFAVRETIPVAPGPMVLLYPQWLPGSHSPTGRVDKLAGLIVSGNGQRIEWRRDEVDVFAFHLTVPPGVTDLDVAFQLASPVEAAEGRVVMTPDMLNLQWIALTLYPAGYFTRQIPVQASAKLPDGWEFATALDTAFVDGEGTTFKPVPFETLADSPMFAGRYFRRFELDPGSATPVRFSVMADRPELLSATPQQIAPHQQLVQQALKLFGSRHFDHYELMLALTDKLGGIGLEHHRSSENASVPGYFTDWDRVGDVRDLLAHEFAHSWNGKFRRPADLWTPNYNVPMRGSLLWVYEGQTQYWGFVLAARSGLLTKQQALDAFATTAATYDHRIGREWKTLQDTTNDPIAGLRRALPWRSFERSEDYYSEGQLVWLDVDTLIRERSGGRRSLDDFAQAFFGMNDGSYVPATYTFDDVVKALNQIEAYDWTTFLRTRLESHGPGAPLDGLARGGYRLVYTERPTDFFRASEARRQVTDLTYSLGMTIGPGNRVADVLWQGPAFHAGLTVGATVTMVNGVQYDGERIKSAVTAATETTTPIELTVKNGDRTRTLRIDYHSGLKYPRLEREIRTPARLDQILTPRT